MNPYIVRMVRTPIVDYYLIVWRRVWSGRGASLEGPEHLHPSGDGLQASLQVILSWKSLSQVSNVPIHLYTASWWRRATAAVKCHSWRSKALTWQSPAAPGSRWSSCTRERYIVDSRSVLPFQSSTAIACLFAGMASIGRIREEEVRGVVGAVQGVARQVKFIAFPPTVLIKLTSSQGGHPDRGLREKGECCQSQCQVGAVSCPCLSAVCLVERISFCDP